MISLIHMPTRETNVIYVGTIFSQRSSLKAVLPIIEFWETLGHEPDTYYQARWAIFADILLNQKEPCHV